MASSAPNPLKRPLEAEEEGYRVEVKKQKQASKEFEPRSYQIEVFEVASRKNTIAVLETGTGKTVIAVMLINKVGNDANLSRERRLIVFLAPTVHLVIQQFEVIKMHTDLKVTHYYGAKGVDQWDAKAWKKEISTYQVMVMTPQILLDALRYAYITLDHVCLMVFDECHRATGNHPYTRIMKEFYHKSMLKPTVFGMTASPVIRKGVSSVIDCEDQLSELESILDSKIYTVADRSEIEPFVPAAKEVNRYYQPNLFLHESLKTKLGSLWTKFDSSMAHLLESPLYQFRDIDEIYKESRKRLSNGYAKIAHCLDYLGLVCASEAAKICIETVHLPYSAEGHDFSRQTLELYNLFLMEVLHTIAESLPHDHETLLKTESGCLEAIQMGYISPKLYELMQIFQSFGLSKKVLCLIFVERIITAKVIERFMKKIGYLSHFAVRYLTGGGSSPDALTPKMQKDTLDLFRSGKANLLFTTDVAEEGIDVPECSYVIRFDLPKTVRSYVQSHGRARQPGSYYIIMLERGNIQQKDLLFDIIRSAQSLKDTTSNRDPDAFISKICCNEEIDAYCVESTGATITADSSVSLIYRYCEQLPRDKYFTPKPVFQFSTSGASFECTLSLPPSAAFQTLAGPINRNSHVAKQLVCLEACKRLHQMRALNDHLLPSIEESFETELIEKDEKSSSGAGTTKRKELHGTTSVRALSGNWAHQQDGVTLQGYKIKFSCDLVGQNYSGFLLVIDAMLDEDVACAEIDLYLVSNVVKASVFPCGPIHLDVEQVKQAKLFQGIFFNGLFGKLFKGSRKAGGTREFLLKDDNISLWSTLNMYMLLPLEPASFQDHESLCINWKAVNASVHVVDFVRNSYTPGAECGSATSVNSLGVPMVSSTSSFKTDCCTSDIVHLANESAQIQKLKDMVVLAIHTGKIYSVLDVETDLSADSPFDGISDRGSSHFKTYSEYFNKKYGILLKHPGQPLLLLKHSHNPHNLLSSKSKYEGSSASKTLQNHAHMPPELLVHIDVPLEVLKSFYLLPSLMYRLESLMLASQLREEIAYYSSSSHISSSLILEAITTLRCCEDFSLERLELLGDSVLKYVVSCYLFVKFPDKHEGQLSARRSRTVCNATLHKFGTERNVQGYIRDAAFEPRRWIAPGQFSLHPAPCVCGVNTSQVPRESTYETEATSIVIGKACDRGHRWICSKTIADCVEALIGAYYVAGGLSAALAFMKWLGINVEFEPELVEEAVRAVSISSYTPKVDEIEILQSKLNYEFNAKGLLVEAITHASDEELGALFCYQRLEFLGDSVLDLLITWHLFKSHKDIDPGELTDLRSASVNNETFAQVAVRHKLQVHLQHDSGVLTEQITEYVKRVEESLENQNSLLSIGSSKGPKVLGDMVESIAGAILIDTKLNLNKVWEIFEPLLSPIVTPDKLELPPLRELIELCSHLGYFINTKCMNKGEMVIVKLQVQLEDVLLVREGCERNKKAAKGQAALLLLKDLEERGLSHTRYATKRKQHGDKSVDDSCHLTLDMNVSTPRRDYELGESEKLCDSKLSTSVPLSVKMQKGGPRSALYELCKRSQWLMPTFESSSQIPSVLGILDKGAAERNEFNGFVSSITLHIPDSSIIKVKGDMRTDKKSSQDSAALAMLYELQKQGICCIKEI